MQTRLILASSSPYRKQLMDRLGLEFEVRVPAVDEELLAGESPVEYVSRLAESKAAAVAEREPAAIVIGSDQCAVLGRRILGKPGTHERALQQLLDAQGKTVVFHTAVCVLGLERDFRAVVEVPFSVDFRTLGRSQLEHYLRVDQPYDCAGSFKAEGFGVCLFERMRGDDPSALIGLPLLSLIRMLEEAGIEVI